MAILHIQAPKVKIILMVRLLDFGPKLKKRSVIP